MKPLGVVTRLLNALHQEGIRYCHWKSNEHLMEGLAGLTDLDVLVDRDQVQPLERILADCGYKRFSATPNMKYPAVEDYLALDKETGELVHLHLHYRLTLGEKHLKGYRLPWETIALSTRRWNSSLGIYTIDPNLEMLLLMVRAVLKIRLRDRVAESLGRPYFRGGLLREYRWLQHQVDKHQSTSLCRRLLGADVSEAYAQLLEGKVTLKKLMSFGRRARDNFNTWRTYGPVSAAVLRHYRELGWIAAVLCRRYAPVGYPLRRTVPTGGVLIAIIGSDGSGKSTLASNVTKLLTRKIDVLLVYLGSGDGPSSVLRYPLKVARRLMSGTSVVKSPEHSLQPRRFRLLRTVGKTVWAITLALEKRRKLRLAWRARNLGMVVISDRYPQTQIPGFNDGPLLTAWLTHPNRFLRSVARWESTPYKWAHQNPPDLVIKLSVSPETAIRRKPDMPIEEITRRIEAVRALQFPAETRVATIDADRPLDLVAVDVRTTVWEQI